MENNGENRRGTKSPQEKVGGENRKGEEKENVETATAKKLFFP